VTGKQDNWTKHEANKTIVYRRMALS
jgi:hypothetical protein